MNSLRIAVYPGDGIGQEVLPAALRVLQQALARDGKFELATTDIPWGADYYFEHGNVVPADFLDQLRSFDAIYLGAIGDPQRLPDHVTLAPLVRIRQSFDQYVCMRPALLLPGVRSPLADVQSIDMLVLRENSEGEYVVCGGQAMVGTPREVAIQSALHTRTGVERILRFGFELARQRRNRLTMVTKSNALVYGMVLWDSVFEDVRQEFADVESHKTHADAIAMDFVRRPGAFDVVVASNLFGDLLTDLAGVLVGGLGLAPSANINPDRRFPSMFEPVHGSAPDIAGQGIANPAAAIASGAMMLEWLGCEAAATLVREALAATIARGDTTPDIGGQLTTKEMADRVASNIA